MKSLIALTAARYRATAIKHRLARYSRPCTRDAIFSDTAGKIALRPCRIVIRRRDIAIASRVARIDRSARPLSRRISRSHCLALRWSALDYRLDLRGVLRIPRDRAASRGIAEIDSAATRPRDCKRCDFTRLEDSYDSHRGYLQPADIAAKYDKAIPGNGSCSVKSVTRSR